MPKKGRQATRMTPGFTGPFKGEPQPGTLFDKRALDQLPANFDATRDRPGPRGYSPNRLAHVMDAWSSARHVKFDERGNSIGAEPILESNAVRDAHHFGPTRNQNMGRGRSRLIDTLARSTVDFSNPEEHSLNSLHTIRIGTHSAELAGEYEHSPMVANPHWKPENVGQPMAVPGEPRITLYTSGFARNHPAEEEQTFLHELGHHESYLQANDSAYDYGESHRMQATEEAFADKFALTHFRPDPRNKKPYDPRENTYAGRGLAQSHFSPAAETYKQVLPREMHPSPHNRGQQFQDFYQPELGEEQPTVRSDVFQGQGVANPAPARMLPLRHPTY